MTLSSGPATISLADYTCQTYPKAKNALEKLGFVVVLGDPVPVLSQCPNTNFIAAQDPAAGTLYQSKLCAAIKELARQHERTALVLGEHADASVAVQQGRLSVRGCYFDIASGRVTLL